MKRVAVVAVAFAAGVGIALAIVRPRATAPPVSSPPAAPSPSARELFDRGEIDAAAEACRRDDTAEANALLGFIQYRKGDLAGARSLLDRAQRVDARHAPTYLYRGQVSLSQSDWRAARVDFDAFVALSPDRAEGWALRADARFHEKEHAGAVEDATRAIKLDATCAAAYFARGAAFAALGRADDAIRDYTNCLSLRPDHVGAVYNRGRLYGLARDYERAVADWERAIALKPALKEELEPLIDAVAFPPEGFGAASKGGEGGRVVWVTTLDDSGEGSLREALWRPDARIIRFRVEGTIDLKSRIKVTDGRVTIDGSGKVTIARHGLSFVGDCDDILVRHLRVRVTEGGADGDGLLFWGKDGGAVERVLVDRCSIMGATDEGINTWGDVRDVTVQWTIVAESHYGWLSGPGSDRVTIHHCLFANNMDRSPKLQGGLFDVVNNVIVNWSVNNATKIDAGARANVVNNVYVPGPRSSAKTACVSVQGEGTRVLVSGNVGAPEDVACGRFDAPAVTTQTAAEAKALVLKHAGARMRDAADERVLREIK